MADDEVGVEPPQLAELASALENLRDVLAQNVPVIVNTLEEYWNSGTGTPVNLSPLKQAQAHSPQEAADMRARSDLAQAWLDQADACLTSVTIPWKSATLDGADAQLQARRLVAAERSGNRAEVQAIEQDMRDHQADKDWLADFWSQSGVATASADLAAMLHRGDGSGIVTLTAADQKVLGTYAASLAAACNLGGLSGTEGNRLVADFSNAAKSDPWSAVMLLRAGPAGNAYGSRANSVGADLLVGASEAALTAYANGKLDMPIDLRSAEQVGDEPSNSRIAAAVAANDPLTAMLALDTQNKTAAEEVMAGYSPVTGKFSQTTGQEWATLLMSKANKNNTIYAPVYPRDPSAASYMKIMISNGMPPGMLDGDQSGPEWNTYGIPVGTVAGFLNAATSGPRGGGNLSTGKFSAYAAANIILGTPAAEGDDGLDLPQSIRQSLANTFLRYTPDIAASVGDEDQGTTAQLTDQVVLKNGKQVAGPWSFDIPTSLLSNYLQQVSADPTTYGNLEAAVATKMGLALGMKLAGISDGTYDDPFGDLASLYGRLMKEQTTNQYLIGEGEDIRNAELNAMLDFAEDNVDVVPVVGDDASKIISYDEKLKILGFPQIPEFSMDNASDAVQDGLQNFSEKQLTVMLPIVQGLVHTGQVQPQSSWYQNGQVVPNQAFYEWWRYQKSMELTDYSSPVKDKGGATIGYSSQQLDEWMLQASQWMQLGGSGFNTDFPSDSSGG